MKRYFFNLLIGICSCPILLFYAIYVPLQTLVGINILKKYNITIEVNEEA